MPASSEAVMSLTGGARVWGRNVSTPAQVIGEVRRGLPYAALDHVMRELGMGRPEVMRLLRIPARTLDRRKREKRLSADESDRLYRLVRVFAHAGETFGSPARAAAWMRQANRGLGGLVPLELLDTDAGAREVEGVLIRIDHGIHG